MLWRSSWPLTEGEQQFVQRVLLQRERKLREPGYDDKSPVPEGMQAGREGGAAAVQGREENVGSVSSPGGRAMWN